MIVTRIVTASLNSISQSVICLDYDFTGDFIGIDFLKTNSTQHKLDFMSIRLSIQ